MGETSAVSVASDPAHGIARQEVRGLSYRSEDGRDIIEGYAATGTDVEGSGQFSEDVLRAFAQQIEGFDVNIVLPKYSKERLRAMAENGETDPTIGDVDHESFDAAPGSDTRIMPAFRVFDAEYDGFGTKIRAEINTNLPEESLDNFKSAIKDGWLNAFSLEYRVLEVTKRIINGKTEAIITEAQAKGVALTGRPKDPASRLTGFDLRSYIDSDNVAVINEEQPEEARNDMNSTGGIMPENEGEQDGGEEQSLDVDELRSELDEVRSLVDEHKETLDEYRTKVDEQAETINELQEERDELRSELDDHESKDDVMSSLDEIRSKLDELDAAEQPVTESEGEQERDEARSQSTENDEEQQAVERLGNEIRSWAGGDLGTEAAKSAVEDDSFRSVLADKYGMSEDTVKAVAAGEDGGGEQ